MKVVIATRAVENTRNTLIAVDHQLNELHNKLARAEAAAKAQELLQSKASAANRDAERDLHHAQVEQAAAAAAAAGFPPARARQRARRSACRHCAAVER